MVSANALQRTIRIRVGMSTGTAFSLDINGRQYIITAKHVLNGFSGKGTVQVYHEKQWKSIECLLIGNSTADVAVLAADRILTPSHPLPPSVGNLFLSQDMYFLGFPYGLHLELGEMNNGYPLPLVKKGILSTFDFHSDPQNRYLLLDGNNNPGFSGGPVLYCDTANSRQLKVAGVISGYRFEPQPVLQPDGAESGMIIKYNTGIIVASSIQHANEIIEANPRGFPLK